MRDVPEMRDVLSDGRVMTGTSGVVGLLDVPVTGGDGTEGKFADVCREPPVEVKKGEVREGLIGTGTEWLREGLVGTGTDLLSEGLTGTRTDLLCEGAGGDQINDPPGVPVVRMNDPIEPDDRGPEPLGKGGRMEVTVGDWPNDNVGEDDD
jgi:hypothetical protein